MPKYPGGQTKSFTVTFPKLSGIGSNVVVSGVVASDPERALSIARYALHQCADQADSKITVA